MQKKLTPHCQQRLSEDYHFTICSLLTISRQWKKIAATRWKAGENSCWLHHGNQLWQKQSLLINGIKPKPSTNIRMNGKVLEEADQFRYVGSMQTKYGTSLTVSKDQPGTCTLSHGKASSTVEKQKKWSVFLQRLSSTNLLSCQYVCSDVTAGHWLWIWRDESKPLEANTPGGCLAYHT